MVARGDGLLSHDLLPGEKGPQDACGVFGVWAPGDEVAKLTYFGLYALQHRGQESAGMAVSDGSQILVYKDMGLVSQVFTEANLESLRGHVAIGHTRYSTTGASVWENAQPTFRSTATGHLALAHNGNITNTAALRRRLIELSRESGELPLDTQVEASSDTDVLAALLASHPDLSVMAAAMEELPHVKGAFSLVFMDDDALYGARDPQGIRPLSLGRLERGWVLASETAALDIIGASFVREIEPGEIIVIDDQGVRSERFAEADPKGCLFEYVYLARPDTTIAGRSIQVTRVETGRILARELVRMLREAGAREVHVRISSPPVEWPCFYGIDFASRSELVANGLTVEQICRSIGADSLGYVSLDALIAATTIPKEKLCRACFDGVYPVEIPEAQFLGKQLFEGIERRALDGTLDIDGVSTMVGGGAADALERP